MLNKWCTITLLYRCSGEKKVITAVENPPKWQWENDIYLCLLVSKKCFCVCLFFLPYIYYFYSLPRLNGDLFLCIGLGLELWVMYFTLVFFVFIWCFFVCIFAILCYFILLFYKCIFLCFYTFLIYTLLFYRFFCFFFINFNDFFNDTQNIFNLFFTFSIHFLFIFYAF